jgi:hypothetical protein
MVSSSFGFAFGGADLAGVAFAGDLGGAILVFRGDALGGMVRGEDGRAAKQTWRKSPRTSVRRRLHGKRSVRQFGGGSSGTEGETH